MRNPFKDGVIASQGQLKDLERSPGQGKEVSLDENRFSMENIVFSNVFEITILAFD